MSKEGVEKVKKILQSPALRQVAQWSKCVRGKVFAICFLQVIIVLCALAVTVVTKGIIDAATSFHLERLIWYGIALLVLTLLMVIFGFVLSIFRTKASAKLQVSLQKTLVSDWMQKEYAALKEYHSGELVNRVFSDVGVIKAGVLNILPNIVSTVVGFVGAATILIALDWRFVLLLLIVGLIGAVIVLLFRGPMKKRHKRMQEAEDHLHAILQETFENLRLIKASVSETRVLHKIGNSQRKLEREQVRQGVFSVVMNNGMGLTFDLTWLFCMIWGSVAIFRGELSYGALAAMIQLIGRVQGPIANAVSIAGEVYHVISSAERLLEISNLPSETSGEAVKDFDRIDFDHVSYHYEDCEEGAEDILQDVCCSIHKGDFIALTGISGGGKSTLFQLLLGIYQPQRGEIRVLGETESGAMVQNKEFTEQSKESAVKTDGWKKVSHDTRSLFAYVPQGNSLFSGTLRENLTLFADDVTEGELEAALRVACIDDLVAEIGLDAELGERGVGISEGQAQRVAVARALIAGAPILLLDEATSALDEETEAKMLKNLSELHEKTCLIVTHRPAALSICAHEFQISKNRLNIIR